MDYDWGLSRRNLLAAVGSGVLATAAGCLNRVAGQPPNYVPEEAWGFETKGPILGVPVVSGGRLFVGSDDGYMYALEEEGAGDIADLQDFPMSGYDLRCTNAPDGIEGPRSDVVERWRFDTNGPIRAAPVVWDGALLFGSNDNYFYSVDIATGEENWRVDTGSRIMSGASVNDGVVYLGSGLADEHPTSEGGGVFALDVEDGGEIWSVEYDDGVLSPPTYYDGIVYHGDQENTFVARDAETGEEVWEYESDRAFCVCRPAIDGESVYIGGEDRKMYSFDVDSGEKEWEFDTGDVVVSSPTVMDGSVYFGSYDNSVYAVDADNGEKIWQYETNGAVVSSPAYRGGLLYTGSLDGAIYALDGNEGELVWGFETDERVASSPLVTEDRIYTGSEDSRLYALTNREVPEDVHREHRNAIERRNVTAEDIVEERIREHYASID